MTDTTYECEAWRMIRADGLVEVEEPRPTTHGDPSNYKYAALPFPDDERWTDAPVRDGKLHFDKKSRIPSQFANTYERLDFTYFSTRLDIPDDVTIDDFRVTIGQVDDGARIYLFNDRHVGGDFRPADDAKLHGENVTADLTDAAAHGRNVVCIVQFDDCPTENKLTGGVEIRLNDQPVVVNPELELEDTVLFPPTFKMETYGVHGQGQTGDTYWIGSNKGKPGIITGKQAEEDSSYIYEIEKIEVDGGVALKVTNLADDDGKDHYLPDLAETPTIYRPVPPVESRALDAEVGAVNEDASSFISLELDGKPKVHLRHKGFLLHNDAYTGATTGDAWKTYQGDATWRYHALEQ